MPPRSGDLLREVQVLQVQVRADEGPAHPATSRPLSARWSQPQRPDRAQVAATRRLVDELAIGQPQALRSAALGGGARRVEADVDLVVAAARRRAERAQFGLPVVLAAAGVGGHEAGAQAGVEIAPEVRDELGAPVVPHDSRSDGDAGHHEAGLAGRVHSTFPVWL